MEILLREEIPPCSNTFCASPEICSTFWVMPDVSLPHVLF